ncbi:11943_t:CDS:2, partial [Ambispora gerdemannii]
PEYEKAATALKKHKIKLAKVDCTAETELCQEYEVTGYPTLKVFRDGNATDYTGGRKEDSIVSYMKKQTLPAVSDVTVENLDTFKDSENVVIIGFFTADSQEEYNTFTKVAESNRDSDFVFGATGQQEAAAKADIKAPAVVLYKQFDERNVTLYPPFDEEALSTFIKTNSIPLLAEIGPENYATYVDSGLPLAFYSMKMKNNELLLEEWPAFGIQQPEEGSKYPHDQSKEITTENIQVFVRKFLKGEIPPSIKSESIPEKNDDPVYVLVADSFEDVVYDKNKDILVEFYAPWCGHCKKLAPIYEKLGETYQEFKDKIVIAKMDATLNDLPAGVPFKISGFPTIKLFKAGENNDIVDYQGDRTFESFIKFLDANAFNKVEVNVTSPSASSDAASE